MTHRVDLIALGYKGIKYASKNEIEKLAKERKRKGIKHHIVKADNNLWELYEKEEK